MSWDYEDGILHLVTAGDASLHLSDDPFKNPAQLTVRTLLQKAQPAGYRRAPIHLHMLRVVSIHQQNHQEHATQFKELAAGAAPGHRGRYAEFDGRSGAPEFISELTSFVAAARSGLAQAQVGKVPAASTPGFHAIMRKLRAAQEGETGDVGFARGFTGEFDTAGRQTFVVATLLQRDRAQLFVTALDYVTQALEQSRGGGEESLPELINHVRAFSAGAHLGEPIDADTPLHEFLGSLLAIPVKSGIFSMSLRSVKAMTASDFDSWVAQLREHREVIQQLLEQPTLWFGLHPGVPRERHLAFVRTADLP